MNKKKEFSKIYDRFSERIFRFIFLKVSSEETAKDLTSETFLKVWKAFQSSKIENPKAFLYKTARNLIADFYREKEKINPNSLESLPPTPDPRQNPLEKIIFDEKVKLVQKALSNLKEDYQTAIILRYIDRLSLKEISEILEKSPQATRVLIHRALLSLKKECNKKRV
jgi:RNA polymerase sigma-70 factor (ECF subfamily)